MQFLVAVCQPRATAFAKLCPPMATEQHLSASPVLLELRYVHQLKNNDIMPPTKKKNVSKVAKSKQQKQKKRLPMATTTMQYHPPHAPPRMMNNNMPAPPPMMMQQRQPFPIPMMHPPPPPPRMNLPAPPMMHQQRQQPPIPIMPPPPHNRTNKPPPPTPMMQQQQQQQQSYVEERVFRERFLELAEYKAMHGHCNVVVTIPAGGNPPNYDTHRTNALAMWVQQQRTLYEQKKIPTHRINLLNTIGFDWTSIPDKGSATTATGTAASTAENNNDKSKNDTPDDQLRQEQLEFLRQQQLEEEKKAKEEEEQRVFNEHLVKLVEYRANHNGSCNVPKQNYKKLRNWILDIRQKKETNELSEQRIKILDSLGFTWKDKTRKELATDKRCDVFQSKFEELVLYKRRHGNTNVPYENGELGKWVERIRVHKRETDHVKNGVTFPNRKHPRPTLTDDQILQLTSIGFQWNLAPKVSWDVRYDNLVDFIKEHGHSIVPQHYSKDKSLGKWVMKQRVQYNRYNKGLSSFMNEERIDKLNAVGFTWDATKKGKQEQQVQPNRRGGKRLSALRDVEGGRSTTASANKKRRKQQQQQIQEEEDDDDEEEEEQIEQYENNTITAAAAGAAAATQYNTINNNMIHQAAALLFPQGGGGFAGFNNNSWL